MREPSLLPSSSGQRAYRGLIPDAYLDALSVERRGEIWSRILAETIFLGPEPSSWRTASSWKLGAISLRNGLAVRL
jgi:hypothetical protein